MHLNIEQEKSHLLQTAHVLRLFHNSLDIFNCFLIQAVQLLQQLLPQLMIFLDAFGLAIFVLTKGQNFGVIIDLQGQFFETMIED